jgi:phosphoserine phosphatase
MNNSTESKIIIFDMGSALIDSETLDALAKASGVISKVEEITKRVICGDLDFGQVLAEKVSLLEKIGFAIAFNPTHIRREYTDVVIQKRSNPLALLLNLFLSVL